MAVATLDTLKFANALKLNLKDSATRDDLAVAKNELRSEIRESEQRLNAKIETGLSDVKLSIAVMRGELSQFKWICGFGFSLVIAMLGVVLRILFLRGPT